MPRYFASTYKTKARIAPTDHHSACGFADDPSGYPIVGIAYPVSYVGGWQVDFDAPARWVEDSVYLGKPEVVWSLVIDKVEVGGRFALRMGEFVELSEDAT